MPLYPFPPPSVLDSLPEELAEFFRGLELTLLKQICERLNLADQLNEVTVDSMRALRSHGISQKDIEKAIRDVTGISQKKLNKLLDDVVERNQKYYTEMIDLAHVTAPATLVNADDIEAIRKQAQREFRNITASMGFLVDSGRTMLKPAEAYQWALDSAVTAIQSGAVSYNEAIRQAVRELADSGLKTVDYESGHVDQIDTAVRRAVQTGVNQLNQQYREASMDYLETDLVEVTAHLGARNIDGPKGWENHAAWQGKVYRWRGHGEQMPEKQDKRQDPSGSETTTTPQTPAQRHSEPVDVAEEYKRTATPGVGEITYDQGYKHGKHNNEARVAEWLHREFGGDIHCYDERGYDKKSPDYLWRGKLWELKGPSTATSTDNAIKKALKQIQDNPGGIILDYGEHEITTDIMSVIRRRIERGNLQVIDVIYLQNNRMVNILRYKK